MIAGGGSSPGLSAAWVLALAHWQVLEMAMGGVGE